MCGLHRMHCGPRRAWQRPRRFHLASHATNVVCGVSLNFRFVVWMVASRGHHRACCRKLLVAAASRHRCCSTCNGCGMGHDHGSTGCGGSVCWNGRYMLGLDLPCTRNSRHVGCAACMARVTLKRTQRISAHSSAFRSLACPRAPVSSGHCIDCMRLGWSARHCSPTS